MGKKKKKIDLGADASGFGHNPFAAALAATTAPEASAEVKASLDTNNSAAENTPWDLSSSAKLVLRCDAKRRRGRVVTLVEGIEGGSKSELKQLARTLGKRLGTGASVDSETVILIQGDHRERLPELLEAQGAKTIKVIDFK